MIRLLSLAVLLSVVSLWGFAAPSERSPSGLLPDQLTLTIVNTTGRPDLKGKLVILNRDTRPFVPTKYRSVPDTRPRWIGGPLGEFSVEFVENPWKKDPNPYSLEIYLTGRFDTLNLPLQVNCIAESAWLERHQPFLFSHNYRVERAFSINFKVSP